MSPILSELLNMPANKIIIGNHPEVIDFFQNEGIECLVTKDNTFVDPSVRNHADIEVLKLNDNTYLADTFQQDIILSLRAMGFEVTETDKPISGSYPEDVILNVAVFKNSIICNKNSHPMILEDRRKHIFVNQGYVNCSVCKVSESAFITDDKGIYDHCSSDFDVLLVSKGDIFLPGHSYGFIGGASGKAGNTIFFFGDINTHRDCEKITSFINKHGFQYHCIGSGQLTDIGSFVEIR